MCNTDCNTSATPATSLAVNDGGDLLNCRKAEALHGAEFFQQCRLALAANGVSAANPAAAARPSGGAQRQAEKLKNVQKTMQSLLK